MGYFEQGPISRSILDVRTLEVGSLGRQLRAANSARKSHWSNEIHYEVSIWNKTPIITAFRRMTKETVKVAGRQLGKVCLTHPTIAFDYMLDRVQSFQNLIGPVVESMRYLSDLAFDVLSCKSLRLNSTQLRLNLF